jgi:hypothetical protein
MAKEQGMTEYGIELYMDTSLDNITILTWGKACQYETEVREGDKIVYTSSSLTLRDALTEHHHVCIRCIEGMQRVEYGVPFRVAREER